MPDLLRERFDELRHAVEHTEAAGLHDVRVRRTRRTRARVAAASAMTVAALAFGGLVVLPQWSDNTATSAGDAEVLNDSAGGGGSDRVDAGDQAGTEQAPPENAPELLTLTADSLLTAPELAAAGEQGPQLLLENPGPVLPPLCGATTATQQYSDPTREFSVLYAVADGSISQYAAEYSSETAATQAIDRVHIDALACPDSNPVGRVNVSSRTPGEILVLSFVEPTAGPSGGPRFSEITILRTANIVTEVALVPLQMGLGGGAARASTVAAALAAKLQDSGGGN